MQWHLLYKWQEFVKPTTWLIQSESSIRITGTYLRSLKAN